jgi:YD repeat-containing protein
MRSKTRWSLCWDSSRRTLKLARPSYRHFSSPCLARKALNWMSSLSACTNFLGQRSWKRRERAIGTLTTRKKHYAYNADGLEQEVQLENCYAGSIECTKTQNAYDVRGRRTAESRLVSDTPLWSVTAFEYIDPQAFVPTVIKTQDSAGIVATTTTMSYDDFGSLVEQVSPDAGTTQFQVDAIGRVVTRRRLPSGSITAYTYDGLGRLRTVDNDALSSVDCSTAVPGTPLYDEEFWYDTCPTSKPTGFSCSFSAGRLTMARTLQHCAGVGNLVFKRGVWKNYDNHGRLLGETIAIHNGVPSFCSSASCPDTGYVGSSTMNYTYSLAGRPLSISNPLNASYGQNFSYITNGSNPGVGRLSSVSDSLNGVIVQNIGYKSFGDVEKLASMIVYGGVTAWFKTEYNLEYEVTRRRATSGDTATTWSGGLPDIAYARDATGLVTSRTVTGAYAPSSKWYLYDRQGRLTCEKSTNASPGTCPVAGASNLMANYAYSNAASMPNQTPGPNNIVSAAWKNSQQTSPSYGEFHISSSNQLSSITTDFAAGPWINYYYDDQGRRTKDDDSVYIGTNDDARTYTYLPNERLASIQGARPVLGPGPGYVRTWLPYTLSFAYDTGGMPYQVMYSEVGTGAVSRSWDLYWDAGNRLVAAKYVPSLATPATYQRWAFFYEGQRRVGAVLEDVTAISTTTYRLSYFNDLIGVPSMVMTSTGGIAVAQNVDSYGWRTTTLDFLGKWMPFGLPGQLIFDDTTAKALTQTCVGGTGFCATQWLRPPIAWHGQRVFDPMAGRFTSADPVDERRFNATPESYQYSRGEPVRITDPSGLAGCSGGDNFVLRPPYFGCSPTQITEASAARTMAILNISKCAADWCPKMDKGSFKKEWINAIANMNIECVNGACTRCDPMACGCTTMGTTDTQLSFGFPVCDNNGYCLMKDIAHEALHGLGMGMEHSKQLKGDWPVVNECIDCSVAGGMAGGQIGRN